jgi:hypothetical protein
MCGPVIQPDLFTIVVNFRTYQFVLIGDLTKMYRSVRLHPDDFKRQQILWRSDPNELLKSFSLTTLTYGLKPSSFIATRCPQELSNQNNKSFPKGSEIIRKHFSACMHFIRCSRGVSRIFRAPYVIKYYTTMKIQFSAVVSVTLVYTRSVPDSRSPNKKFCRRAPNYFGSAITAGSISAS